MIPTQMVTQNNKFANQCRGSNRLKDGRNRRMHVIMCASVYIPTNIAQNIPASKLCKVKLHLSLDVECHSHIQSFLLHFLRLYQVCGCYVLGKQGKWFLTNQVVKKIFRWVNNKCKNSLTGLIKWKFIIIKKNLGTYWNLNNLIYWNKHSVEQNSSDR